MELLHKTDSVLIRDADRVSVISDSALLKPKTLSVYSKKRLNISILIFHETCERMGGNIGHEFIRFLIVFDPLSNGVFPLLGDADHPSFFAIAYAQIQ